MTERKAEFGRDDWRDVGDLDGVPPSVTPKAESYVIYDVLFEHLYPSSTATAIEGAAQAVAEALVTSLAESRRICYCPNRGDNHHLSGDPGCVLDQASSPVGSGS